MFVPRPTVSTSGYSWLVRELPQISVALNIGERDGAFKVFRYTTAGHPARAHRNRAHHNGERRNGEPGPAREAHRNGEPRTEVLPEKALHGVILVFFTGQDLPTSLRLVEAFCHGFIPWRHGGASTSPTQLVIVRLQLAAVPAEEPETGAKDAPSGERQGQLARIGPRPRAGLRLLLLPWRYC